MEYYNKAYLLIGGNVGDSRYYLGQAIELLQKECGNVSASSSIYKTAPWGIAEQNFFLNQALQLETNLGPVELMHTLLNIEEQMGRVRAVKNGPRIIDLDLLFYNLDIIVSPELTVPHKELQNRRFVLEPLNEIARDLVHPVLQKTVKQLLIDCPDELGVEKLG